MEEVTTTKKKKKGQNRRLLLLPGPNRADHEAAAEEPPADAARGPARGCAPPPAASQPCRVPVSRCVCKAWHAIVDVHKLMRADLLPLSFGGIMIGFNMLGRTEFLSYRGPGCCAAVSGNLGYLPRPNIPVDGHCNGLLFFLKPWRTLLHGTGHACPGNHLRACAWVLQRTT